MTSRDKEILIDNCINISHYNIALYIYEIIKDRYKYNNKKWLLVDKNDDINYEGKLKEEIKTLIVNDFGNRSIYWSNNSSDIKSIKLLQVADKLKNEKFLKDIIKELPQFYE